MVDSSGSGAIVKRVRGRGATVLKVDEGQRQLTGPGFDVQLDEKRKGWGKNCSFYICIWNLDDRSIET